MQTTTIEFKIINSHDITDFLFFLKAIIELMQAKKINTRKMFIVEIPSK